MSAIQACIDYARKNQLGKPQDKQSTATQAAAELAAKNAELAALRQERDELKQAAVLAFIAIDNMTPYHMKREIKDLDSYLANGLSDKLWEEINAAALARVDGKGEK